MSTHAEFKEGTTQIDATTLTEAARLCAEVRAVVGAAYLNDRPPRMTANAACISALPHPRPLLQPLSVVMSGRCALRIGYIATSRSLAYDWMLSSLLELSALLTWRRSWTSL